MLKKFRTYQLAVAFHSECRKLALAPYLREQLLRAASSVALNLAEGSVKRSRKDQLRFYSMAFGSLRECQGILDLLETPAPYLSEQADLLGAHLHRLCETPTAQPNPKPNPNRSANRARNRN